MQSEFRTVRQSELAVMMSFKDVNYCHQRSERGDWGIVRRNFSDVWPKVISRNVPQISILIENECGNYIRHIFIMTWSQYGRCQWSEHMQNCSLAGAIARLLPLPYCLAKLPQIKGPSPFIYGIILELSLYQWGYYWDNCRLDVVSCIARTIGAWKYNPQACDFIARAS